MREIALIFKYVEIILKSVKNKNISCNISKDYLRNIITISFINMILYYPNDAYGSNICSNYGKLIWEIPILDSDVGKNPSDVFSREEFGLKYPVKDLGNRLQIDESPDGDPAIRVDVKKGENKRISMKFQQLDIPGIEHACLSMQMYLSKNFDFATAGTALGWGLWGGAGHKDSGGVPPELQEGWIVRNATNGTYGSKIYSYHLNRGGNRIKSEQCRPFGCLFGKTSNSSGPLISGKWIDVELEVKINDSNTSNGFARLWIDGHLVVDNQSLIFSEEDNNWLIRGIQFTDMWGGQTSDPRNFSPRDQTIFYRGYKLYDLAPKIGECNDPQFSVFGVGTAECVARDLDGSTETIQPAVADDVRTPRDGQLALDDGIEVFQDSEGVVRALVGGISITNESLSLVEDFVDAVVGVATPIRPLDNDSDPEGGELTLVGFSLPDLGELELAEDRRSFIYRSTNVGSDSFRYAVLDSRGRVAISDVNITVSVAKTTPQLQDDVVQTNQGVPVTFDVLGNDSNPGGGDLTIVAFSRPNFGRIEINSDQTFVYTPIAGAMGVDEFAYTVRNSSGVTANARVVITIINSGDTFANGFATRRRIVIPQQSENAITTENHVFMVKLTDPDLRLQADGGRLRSAQGYDLRFETQEGVVLDHDVEILNLTTGELRAWVRLPIWDMTKDVQISMYYDSTAVTQDPANPNGVWQGYLGRWGSNSGADSSGNGLDLAVMGLNTGELLGPAGDFNGNAVMTRANGSFQSGLSALTVQAIVKADASIIGTNAGILTEGIITGSDSSAGITLQYLASSSNGVENVVHFKARSSDGNAFVLSSRDRHTSEMQIIHGTWTAGEIPKLFLDGKLENSSASSDTRAGVTLGDGPFFIGTGPRNSAAGGWKGLIDEVRLTDRVLPPEVIASEAVNIATPELFYGIGARELPGDQRDSPVAVPFRVVVVSDAFTDIPVLDLDTDDSLSIASVGLPGNGSATVVGSSIRYVPNSGFSGTDQFSYSITDGSSTVSALIQVEVEQPPSPPFDSVLPNGQNVLLLNAPAKRTIFATNTTVQSVLDSALPGDHVILRDGTYSSFSMNRSGTEQDPIVIVAENPQGVVLTDQVSVTGSWLKFDQLAVRNGGRFDVRAPASNLRFDRCLFEDHTNPGIRLRAGVINVRISRCVGRNGGEFFVYADIDGPNPSQGPQFLHIDHSFFTGYNIKSAIRLGDTAHPARAFELNAVVERNYFESNTGHRELIVGKSSRNWVRYNTITGAFRGDIAIRQGSYWNVYGNFVIGAGGITAVATENNIFNNYIAGGVRGIWLMSGDNTWAETSSQRPIYDRAENCIVANNTIIVTTRTSEGAGIGANFGQIKNPATNCDIVNNLILRVSGSAPLIDRTIETGNRFQNNLVSTNSGYTGVGVTVVDPALQLVDGIYRPTSVSPTRGAGIPVVNFGPTGLTFTDDVEGRPRGDTFDIGAEQFGADGATAPMIGIDDVGVTVADPYQASGQ